MQKLRLLVTLLAMVAVVASMSIVSPVMAQPDSPYDDHDYPPGYYDDEYGEDWQVDEVTDEDCDEVTGICEYEVVGEFGGYPAEFELVCEEGFSPYDERFSPYDERFSPYDEGFSPYDEGCTPTDVDLL
ncbi:MAG TPA: hypothetical protein VHF46_01135 [Rubrobacteraceae bacterium]|nr:hypothetical protein [Rubrobacteraceae bacterium]